MGGIEAILTQPKRMESIVENSQKILQILKQKDKIIEQRNELLQENDFAVRQLDGLIDDVNNQMKSNMAFVVKKSVLMKKNKVMNRKAKHFDNLMEIINQKQTQISKVKALCKQLKQILQKRQSQEYEIKLTKLINELMDHEHRFSKQKQRLLWHKVNDKKQRISISEETGVALQLLSEKQTTTKQMIQKLDRQTQEKTKRNSKGKKSN